MKKQYFSAWKYHSPESITRLRVAYLIRAVRSRGGDIQRIQGGYKLTDCNLSIFPQ